MKTIRLVIYGETYWNKGLIYTQNILPLKKLCHYSGAQLEVYSFTSIIMYILHRKEILECRDELSKDGIELRNFLILYYPTRYLTPRWFLLPYFFLITSLYVVYFKISDRGKNVCYNLRSYKTSLRCLSFYGKAGNLRFDRRTDWIEESINAGDFSANGLSAYLWKEYECKFLKHFSKTIFISDTTIIIWMFIKIHNLIAIPKSTFT